MQSTQVKYIFSNPPFLSNSITKTTDFPPTNLVFSKHVVVASARKKKRPSGSIRSTYFMLKSAYLIASKLKILPEPFDTILREFSGGNGNGNGNGGGGWWGHGWSGGFDGWGRRGRKKINWGIWGVVLAILGGGMLWLNFGKELEIDVFSGVLGLTLFVVSVNVRKRGALDWALGFCCCAALVAGFMRKEDLQRFLGTIKIDRKRRRRRGRPF